LGNASDLRGFTLIELIVVVALLSIVLVFTLPRFDHFLVSDPASKTSRWLIRTVKALKENAIREQKRYALHIDMDANTLWSSDASMTDEAVDQAASGGYRLPDGMRLLDVEYPTFGKVSTGRADLFFYPQGYSERALIHIENDDAEILTYSIEPFLAQIGIFEKYTGYPE